MVERVILWVKQNTAVSAVLGGAVVLALVLGGLGGGDPEPVADPTTTTGDGFDIFGRDEEPDDLAGVPTLDCSLYLTIREVGDALTPAGQQDLADVLLMARNEVCTFTAQGQDGFFVRLEPGAPADFEGGGSLLGTSGEPVSDVGDDARWFGGPAAEGGGSTGSISVRQSTPLGLLHFRVYLGRPDLESGAQLEIARDLALAALPRFPGMPLLESIAVNLCELVSDGEAEAVLAEYRDVHPATRDEIFVVSQSAADVDLTQEGESQCTKLILAEIYIRVEQGSLDDFEAGAEYEGVSGEELAGVGDAATWFADVPYQTSFTAPHTLGVVAVRVGESAFRVVLAVPDTPAAEQLEIVTGLATSAVSRITGEGPAGDPVIIEPQASEPPVGLVENLLALEQAGDWTLGEGLAATLGWFAGDVDSSQVIAGEPSPFELGDDVIRLAFDYLNSDPEDASHEEVEALLSRMITSPSRLTATSAFVDQQPETAFRLIRVATSHDAGIGTLASSDFCKDVFAYEGGGCLEEIEIPDLDSEYPERYKLGLPVSPLAPGWNETHTAAAAEAIAESTEVLERNGDMPPTVVLFMPYGQTYAYHDIGDEQFCEIHLGTDLQGDIIDLQQRLAYALALCLFHDEEEAWWRYSVAVYLSAAIFEEHDKENLLSSTLSSIEINSSVGQRAWSDWLFWEYLHPFVGGDGGNVSLARSAAAPGDMAGYPGMDILLRDFYRALTDANVPDLGFGLVPYEPMADVMQISGPLKPANLKPKQFGVKRLRLEVVGHDYACVSITPQGDAQVIWREGREGEGSGGGTNEPPSAISGESVLTVTSASGSGFVSLQVKDVGDNPECEDEPEEPTEFNPPPLQCPFCDLSRYFRNSGS